MSPWDNSDIVLLVEETKLHVHSTVLSIFSPVFKTMLSAGMIESQTKEIKMVDKKLKDVVLFLKAIYPVHQASLKGQIKQKNICV